ncbi:DNA-binding transcriptional regulator, LysR family [Sphingomonas laterariae]|uniref:DNA-binding transcriptional regulator, LysR family n=1 Tax=Edaphosphingomonas laterariae TaxID=861865 RepID=A0A239CDH3_9SPHN|nr:LysR family transcriptional regulator [Sphingomonas laterariae]SNS17524.1 DNA-binding transcriptional regulator, LysR family [Sphingomonas laterariae]
MIDRYLLRYFLAVIDHGNFSRAAEQCNVSQPTLSVGIAKLERTLGRPLFHRTNRRVELTPAGAHFAVHARRIEAEFNLAEAAVAGQPARRTVRLGVLATMPTAQLAAIVAARGAGDEQVEIVEGRERDLLDRLARGRIDAALTLLRADNDRYAREPLWQEGYGLALPQAHPLAGEAVIAAEALADNVMIVRRNCEVLAETSHHFTTRGVRPFFAARTTNDDRALALVAAGLGVTVMPDRHAAPGVVRARLAGFDHVREMGLLYAAHADPADLGESAVVRAVRAVA